MPLPNLVPSDGQVDVQNTTFSVDVLGRFACSTWEEATGNGGAPFSAIVIGAGMYGAYCATKIFRRPANKRVLLLDAGRFLVSEHVQNLARLRLDVPGAIAPANDPQKARELVWGLPWRGNVDFPGLAYCIGGKSIYWGGWCPRLTPGDLQGWPTSTVQYLNANYTNVESETGVEPGTDFIFGDLYEVLRNQNAVRHRFGAEHRSGCGYERLPARAPRGAGQCARFRAFQLRQVQQHAAARRSDPRRRRRVGLQRCEPQAVSRAHRARHQAAHGRRDRPHDRGRCERAASRAMRCVTAKPARPK